MKIHNKHQIEAIKLIQTFVKQYHRPPNYNENLITPEFHNGAFFRKSFGTLNKAIHAAGIIPSRITDPATGKFLQLQEVLICTFCKYPMQLSGSKLSLKKSDARKQKSKGKTGNVFCNRSCAASYNNCHKSYGYRRSKLEIYIEEQLTLEFPLIHFVFNSKSLINSELDIFLPQFKLAIELNGIVHYKPIYGVNKFIRINNNDRQKVISCTNQEIKLVIIDTSKCSTIKQFPKYYELVKHIIEQYYNTKDG